MDCKTVQQNIMPYIERKLNSSQLEEFLDHIDTCDACREELEVYFTIYYALDKLDQEEEASFNIKELLEKDIRKERANIQKKETLRFTRKLICVVFIVMLLVLAVTGIEAILKGDISSTTIYQLVVPEEIPAAERETIRSIAITEQTEPETNHKKQVVITIPETEVYTEPGPLPEEL